MTFTHAVLQREATQKMTFTFVEVDWIQWLCLLKVCISSRTVLKKTVITLAILPSSLRMKSRDVF